MHSLTDFSINFMAGSPDLRQYLPVFAEFYLSKKTEGSLKGFSKSSGTFQVALGGDGCPFGKTESACSFLVSFTNDGRGVASSYNNFLIFGANCDQSSPVVKKYVRSLLPQLLELERTEFEFKGCKYRFKLEELPNDNYENACNASRRVDNQC